MNERHEMPESVSAHWLVPNWPAPPGVRAVFTTRFGGFSQPPYDHLNLGLHVGDAPADVAQNRLALQRAIGAVPVFLNQVHGETVLDIMASSPQGQAADASVSSATGVACTVMVADCLPVLLAHLDAPVVAAAHAGWRGLSGRLSGIPAGQGVGAGPAVDMGAGVLAATFESFAAAVNRALPSPLTAEAVAARTLAWLGPCIGSSAFEVGTEVKAAFEAVVPAAASCFEAHASAQDKYWADLPALGRLRLAALGITQVYGNDGSAQWCTVSQASRFFSHRRSSSVDARGVAGAGRMAACIWLA